MSILQDLKTRFQQATKRQEELAAVVAESQERAEERRRLQRQLDAEEAAEKVVHQLARFKQIMRELPVAAVEFDMAATGLMSDFNAVEATLSSYRTRFTKMMSDHGYSHYRTNGRPQNLPTTVREGPLGPIASTADPGNQLPAWMPAFDDSFTGTGLGRAQLHKAWYDAQSKREEATNVKG